MKIIDIDGLQILDSRGNPTLQVILTTDKNQKITAKVPSGASVGKHEAHELRDNNKDSYSGKGVKDSISIIKTKVKKALVSKTFTKSSEIDSILLSLDNTNSKANIGANTTLGVSCAAIKALAVYNNIPVWKVIHDEYFKEKKPQIPHLMINVINGGRHADWAFDIQEFLLIPQTNNIDKSLEVASETFHYIAEVLKQEGLETLVGDEGGYAPQLSSNEAAFELIQKCIHKISQDNEIDIKLGIDAAASEFYKNGFYFFKKTNTTLTPQQLLNYYEKIIQKYTIFTIEDPFYEEDFDSFTLLSKMFLNNIIIGDDLYTTNILRIKKGIEKKSTNGIIIKPNQIGTMYETAAAITLAQNAGWKIIISHRSGETEETIISDLAVACQADFLKAGSVSRSERLVKYNRLLEIENTELHNQ